MLELFDYLQAHDFRVFVCSGGGLEFMRVFSETVLGVAKENDIGTEAEYEYKDVKLLRTGQFFGGLALGPSKPTHIFSKTGRMPAFAVGNMDTDIEMCEVSKFALLINHDDPNREFEYTKGAEKALAKAKELGWTIR
jgi:phosphoserine phosphatase